MEVDLFPALGRALLYMGIAFILMVLYMQWRWARICRDYIRVLVAQKGGGGSWQLAPKEGGEITITDDKTGITRTWPVNELATIDILYPGVGFVPAFMQRTIRLAIINEGDWEPMLNRSPHRERVASPDVIERLRLLAKNSNEEAKKEIEEYISTLSTGPTREMIADPAVLGGLMKSSVFKALATVSNDFTEAMRTLTNKLNKAAGPRPMVVYLGLALIVVLVAFLIYQQLITAGDIETIREGLKGAI